MTLERRGNSDGPAMENARPGLRVVRFTPSADEPGGRMSPDTERPLSDRLSRSLELLSDEERECLIARTVELLVALRGRAAIRPFGE
ncbi:MAG TPA: hypothetical protein VII52_13360 [Gemmatimonadaceae bacterium]